MNVHIYLFHWCFTPNSSIIHSYHDVILKNILLMPWQAALPERKPGRVKGKPTRICSFLADLLTHHQRGNHQKLYDVIVFIT